MKRRILSDLVLSAALLASLVSCTASKPAANAVSTATPQRGGTIRYATIGEPPSLDVMATTAGITTVETASLYEGLFTLDSHLEPQRSLAESYRVDQQGLRWVIELRRGVLFHDGQEMTSADVLASLNRWGKLCVAGHILSKNLESIEAPERYRIVIHLKQPMPVVPNLLSVPRNQAGIYPKSIIDATGNESLKQYIGTGPYKFVAWKPSQYIELARFEKYQSRSEPADGMAGKREAYADAIRFIPVPEMQQRVQGVQTGLYDFATNILPDLYASITRMPSVEAMIIKPYSTPVVVFNKKQGIFNNLKMRQAVQAAVNVQPMLQAAYGNPIFYRIDPSIFFKETKWWTDTSKALYNQNDPVRAKLLLHEADYRGEVVRILTTHEYDFIFKLSVSLKAQLEAVGMNVSLNVVDWATLTHLRDVPSAYDIFITQMVWNFDPVDLVSFDANWSGWWVNPVKDSLVQQLASEADYKKRLALASQLQQVSYEDVPMLKIGDYFDVRIKNKKFSGDGLNSPLPYFFNSWLSQ